MRRFPAVSFFSLCLAFTPVSAQTGGAEAPAPSPGIVNPGFTLDVEAAGPVFSASLKFPESYDFKTFTLKNPHRFVVDFAGAAMEGAMVTLDTGLPVVKRVRAAQFGRDPLVLRVVLDLAEPSAFAVRDAGGGAFVIEQSSAAKLPNPEIRKFADRVEIAFSAALPESYHTGAVESPPRAFVDLPGYVPPESDGEIAVNAGIVRAVRIAHYSSDPDTVRVVVDATLPARHEIAPGREGKGFTLTVFQPSLMGRTVAVDPGHGGDDPGAAGADGTFEKDVNLAVAKKLERLLRAAGAKVILTRNADGKVSLDERAEIANRSRADVYVSVHSNALERHDRYPEKRGTQTYYYSDGSLKLAGKMHLNVLRAVGLGDMGMYRRRFAVLRKTRMHAVLCEIAYMTHPHDLRLLKSDAFLENAARGIFNGLEDYFGMRGAALEPTPLPEELYAYLPKRLTVPSATPAAGMPEPPLPADLRLDDEEEQIPESGTGADAGTQGGAGIGDKQVLRTSSPKLTPTRK
ncbi:MAG: N-acetylmuramoyl-L-alanine amidase [bacterium]